MTFIAGWNRQEWHAQVERMTDLMRAAPFPRWADLQRKLRQCVVDPHRALLVESYGDEAEGEAYVVVAPGDRVFVYRVRYGRWAWTDLTGHWNTSEFADRIEVGLEILKQFDRCPPIEG